MDVSQAVPLGGGRIGSVPVDMDNRSHAQFTQFGKRGHNAAPCSASGAVVSCTGVGAAGVVSVVVDGSVDQQLTDKPINRSEAKRFKA